MCLCMYYRKFQICCWQNTTPPYVRAACPPPPPPPTLTPPPSPATDPVLQAKNGYVTELVTQGQSAGQFYLTFELREAQTAQNRPEPPRTAQNRPEPPRTAQNRPESPRTAQNRPEPPRTAIEGCAIARGSPGIPSWSCLHPRQPPSGLQLGHSPEMSATP